MAPIITLTLDEEAAGLAAFDAFAAPIVAKASVFTRGAIQAALQSYRQSMVDTVGVAIKSRVMYNNGIKAP
jgi:hypothetical protein